MCIREVNWIKIDFILTLKVLEEIYGAASGTEQN